MYSSTMLAPLGSPKVVAALIGSVNWIGSGIGSVALKYFGRKPLLVYNSIGMGIAHIGLGLAFFLG